MGLYSQHSHTSRDCWAPVSRCSQTHQCSLCVYISCLSMSSLLLMHSSSRY